MMRYVLPDWPVWAALLVLYIFQIYIKKSQVIADYENINLARKEKTAKA